MRNRWRRDPVGEMQNVGMWVAAAAVVGFYAAWVFGAFS